MRKTKTNGRKLRLSDERANLRAALEVAREALSSTTNCGLNCNTCRRAAGEALAKLPRREEKTP